MTTESEAEEVARLRAERDAATAALAEERQRTRRNGWGRRAVVGVFVLLFAVLVPITVTATWAHETVLDTDTWLETVGPIASDPAVTEAVSRQVTDQLYLALDPEQIVADALPPRASFLAGPITNGTKGYVQQAVDNVLQSSQFQTLWIESNRTAHAQLVAVLRGHAETVQTTNGTVVLNLVPVMNSALQSIEPFVSSVVGKEITLPTVTSADVPDVACARISAALDRPLPPTCGQIALFPADSLDVAQRGVRAFDRGVVLLLILTPLIALVALWVSRRRRRTLLQLTIGGMLALVLVRRSTFWLQDELISTGRPENKGAREAIVHDVFHGFFQTTQWILVGLLVVAAIALLTGPYRWAVALRRGARRGGAVTRSLASAAVSQPDPARDNPSLAWVRQHFDVLRVGGVVVALFLLLLDVNFWGFVVIAALLALYEIGLHRLRPPASITLPPAPPPPTPRTSV